MENGTNGFKSIIDTIHDKTIILTFISQTYLPIFKMFYHYFKKHNLDNLLVICLDKESNNAILQLGIRTILMEYEITKRDKFWKFRLDTINQIFKYSKKNIIHTDSDCFWLKNILTILESNDEYDLIGHIAFSQPLYIVKYIGFVFCCGLYFIKYNEQNITIIDDITSKKIHTDDDQVIFNHYIYDNRVTIEEPEHETISKRILLKDNRTFGILKDSIVSRKFKDDLYGFHPYLQSNNIDKKIKEIGEHLDTSV